MNQVFKLTSSQKKSVIYLMMFYLFTMAFVTKVFFENSSTDSPILSQVFIDMIILLIVLFALFNQVTSTPCSVLGNDRCVQIYNNCPSAIFPALSMQIGNETTYDGFFLSPLGHEDYHFPNNVTHIQVWARTKCLTGSSIDCTTGGCGPNIQCSGSYNNTSPVTVAEIWPKPIGAEKYDVTLFNGFNLPVKIAPTVINPPKVLGVCPTLGGCGYTLTNTTKCPEELRYMVGGEIQGCLHPCTVFNTPEYCCTGEYASPLKCLSTPQGILYKAIFKTACPTAIVSPFDIPVGTCIGMLPIHVFYTITFC